MQLHMTIEECEILKKVMEDEKRSCCDALPSLPEVSATHGLQDRYGVGRDLSGRVSRNLQLGFDELEDLAASLVSRKKQLMKEITCLAEPEAKDTFEHQLLVLEHLLEKVTEACAMV